MLINHAGNGLIKKKIKNARALSDRCQDSKETRVAHLKDSLYHLIDLLILQQFHKKAIKRVLRRKDLGKSKVK